jgi:hypothetical protein
MLNENASARTLGMARILVFGLWVKNLYTIRLPDYAALPPEFLIRHGVLRLIPDGAWESVCSYEFLVIFQLALLACLVWLVLGLPRYRPVAIVTCVMLTFFDGMSKSLGDITHADFGILYAAWVLAAFPAADAVSLARRRAKLAPPVMYVAPMVGIPAALLLVYSFVGAFRVHYNGLDLFQSASLPYWLVRNSTVPSVRGFDFGILVAQTPWLLVPMQLGMGIVTLFELLSPICLLSRTFRLMWLGVIVPFHIMSLFLLNVFFWQNLLLILLFMTDIDRVLRRFNVGVEPKT